VVTPPLRRPHTMMSLPQLHADQIPFDLALARRLLRSQFPEYSALPISLVEARGTDHCLYRIGDSLVARFPIIDWAAEQVWSDQRWLPFFSRILPLAVPSQLGVGAPAFGYPFHWSVCSWLEGEPLEPEGRDDSPGIVGQLCDVLAALRAAPTAGAPRAGEERLRGRPLSDKDAETRVAIARLPDDVDRERLTKAWEDALSVPTFSGEPSWFHGDLLPGNVLTSHGRIGAIIDFGGPGVGDPSCDYLAAWNCLTPRERKWFRERCGASGADWTRGIGHTLSQAAIYVPYYLESNGAGARAAIRVLKRITEEAAKESA
jgi:aminoglycoside phosphotransferase (APT) family kinase protein